MSSPHPSFRTLARFWLPLSLNWQLMAVEAPFVASVISRLPNPELNLAAYSVAFFWSLIIESPVMALLSVSAALSSSVESYSVLRRYMWLVNGISFLLHLAFVSPPGFYLISHTLLGLNPNVTAQAHMAAIVMLPWSPLIGFRRFYQGISIRAGQPQRVAQGTVVRVCSMALTGTILFSLGTPGAVAGCGTLIGGVFGEAIAAYLLARKPMQGLPRLNNTGEAVNFAMIHRMYAPLTVTIFLGMAVQPLATFAIGRLAYPVESLAVMPVVMGIMFFSYASTLSLQELTIVQLTQLPTARAQLFSFTLFVGACLCTLLALFVSSSFGPWWLTQVVHLPSQLVPLALMTLTIACVFPLLRAWECYQRGVTVYQRRTTLASIAAILELLVILGVMFGAQKGEHLIGSLMVLLGLSVGAWCAISFMTIQLGRAPAGSST